MSPVTLCSRIPRNFGCSPGAEHSDSSFKLFTWEIERTVAATNHGSPIIEHTPSMTATMSKSRWYPHPFCKKNAMTARSYKMTSEIRRLAGISNEQLETITNYVICSRKLLHCLLCGIQAGSVVVANRLSKGNSYHSFGMINFIRLTSVVSVYIINPK